MPLPNRKESLDLSKHGAGGKILHFPFLTLIIKHLIEVQRNPECCTSKT